MSFISKKVQEYEDGTFRLVKENEDGTGLFLYKGESVILKRCKKGFWKDPATGECVPKEQLRGTEQPKVPKQETPKENKPQRRVTAMDEHDAYSKFENAHKKIIRQTTVAERYAEDLNKYIRHNVPNGEDDKLWKLVEEMHSAMMKDKDYDSAEKYLQTIRSTLKQNYVNDKSGADKVDKIADDLKSQLNKLKDLQMRYNKAKENYANLGKN